MTASRTPVYLDPHTAAILVRCYRGEPKAAVLARALRMLANADGHLEPNGRIRTQRDAERDRSHP